MAVSSDVRKAQRPRKLPPTKRPQAQITTTMNNQPTQSFQTQMGAIIAGMPNQRPGQQLVIEPTEDYNRTADDYVVLNLIDPSTGIDRLQHVNQPLLVGIESVQPLQHRLLQLSDAAIALIVECTSRYYRRGCVLLSIFYAGPSPDRPYGTVFLIVGPASPLGSQQNLQVLSRADVDTATLQVGVVTPLATEIAARAQANRSGRIEPLGVFSSLGPSIQPPRPRNRGSNRALRGPSHGYYDGGAGGMGGRC
ncbi:MAG: hypothetical protein Q9227_003101 [Pyrenula ochraceoflavens]